MILTNSVVVINWVKKIINKNFADRYKRTNYTTVGQMHY